MPAQSGRQLHLGPSGAGISVMQTVPNWVLLNGWSPGIHPQMASYHQLSHAKGSGGQLSQKTYISLLELCYTY